MANTSFAELNTSGNTQASVDTNIPNHHVKAFSSNIMHLAQQKFSRLRETARMEMVNGESKRLERYGAQDAQSKTDWNQSVVYSTSEQSSRWVTPSTEYRAELVDHFSKLRLIYSPEAELTKSFAMTMGREIDYKIIAGLVNDAVTGKDAGTTASMGNANRLVINGDYSAVPVAGASSGGLTFQALLRAKEYFYANEVVQPDENIICVCTGEDIVSLLEDPQLTSSDYMTVKNLVRGDVDSALGFKFIRTELIKNSTKIPNLVTLADIDFDSSNGSIGGAGDDSTIVAGARKILFYSPRRAVALGIAEDIKTKIDPIPEAFHSIQILSTLDMGAVRMDEKECLEVLAGTYGTFVP